jgi:hypothetical protein
MEQQRESASESARGLTQRLRSDGRQQIETRKRKAADQIEEVAQVLSRAGEQLQSQPTLAGYTNQFASSVSNLATRLRDGSIEDLIADTRQLARRNPGVFILGGFAVGVALARFLKASESATIGSGEYAREFSSEYAETSASQEGYPSGAQPPSVGSSEQPYTSPTTGG